MDMCINTAACIGSNMDETTLKECLTFLEEVKKEVGLHDVVVHILKSIDTKNYSYETFVRLEKLYS